MKNVSFENVEIAQATLSNRYYNGVIVNATGNIENIKFTNITVNVPKTNYVGEISNLYNANVSNISLNNVNVTGNNYVGGMIGYVNIAYITDIKANEIQITGTQYVGGIAGHQPHQNGNISDVIDGVIATNIVVEATGNYAGSIAGQGNIKNIELDECQVSGVSYVGGAVGYMSESYDHEKKSVLSNVTVKGTGNYIGGYAGQNNGTSNDIQNSIKYKFPICWRGDGISILKYGKNFVRRCTSAFSW